MPLAFVLDEHLRSQLWTAIQRHNRLGIDTIDATRVGDPIDLPLGSPDPDILLWAERNRRIVISRDLRTMTSYLAAHLQTRSSPGVLVPRVGLPMAVIVSYLAVIANAGFAHDYADAVNYFP